MKTNLLLLTILFTYFGFTQTTSIPDSNFENYLETHSANGQSVSVGDPNSMGDGINGNGLVTTASINTVTYLIVNNKNIADLTGIENFITLKHLSCNFNQLTTLNLSQNIKLRFLSCNNNQLVILDLTQNTRLSHVYCQYNQLTTLNLAQNTELHYLKCQHNQLLTLDLPQNTTLTEITCHNNQLSILDVTQSIVLTDLICNKNQLATLDVTQNTELTYLYCYHNQLTTLDVTQNTKLVRLNCAHNQLTSLNVKNGNNTAIINFRTTNNPNLTCIQVDSASYSTVNWTNVDAIASFNNKCFTILNESIHINNDLADIPNSSSHDDISIVNSVSTDLADIPILTPQTPTADCCPPWNEEIIRKNMTIKTSPVGGLNANYTVLFAPTLELKTQMQTYLDYAHAMNPSINAIIINWRLGKINGDTCEGLGTEIVSEKFTTWNVNNNGIINGGNFWSSYPMEVGVWYKIRTGIYLNDGNKFFNKDCANNNICIRIEVKNGIKILEVNSNSSVFNTIGRQK